MERRLSYSIEPIKVCEVKRDSLTRSFSELWLVRQVKALFSQLRFPHLMEDVKGTMISREEAIERYGLDHIEGIECRFRDDRRVHSACVRVADDKMELHVKVESPSAGSQR